MNHQLVLKKLALSALLVSAVAAPTAANAATKSKDESQKLTASTAALVTPANGFTPLSITLSVWAEPLKLAETYAPNTVEDWKKTLEQYKKVSGLSLSIAAEKVASQEGKVELRKVILSEDSRSVSYIEAGQNLDVSLVETKKVEGKGVEDTITTSIEAVEASADGISSIELSEIDPVFLKAQEALNDATKSKDATAIKGALADLLVQYKEKIEELERAK